MLSENMALTPSQARKLGILDRQQKPSGLSTTSNVAEILCHISHHT